LHLRRDHRPPVGTAWYLIISCTMLEPQQCGVALSWYAVAPALNVNVAAA
jgi:hypothetical protein